MQCNGLPIFSGANFKKKQNTRMSFLIVYLFLIVFGSLFVNGIHLITRGEWETLPNGKKVATGKIFKHWDLFWTKETGKKKLYYSGKELEKMMVAMNRDLSVKMNMYGTARVLLMPAHKAEIPKLELIYGVHIVLEQDENAPFSAAIYKEEINYMFPEWVRDMMTDCITCMSTPFGNIAFWTFVWMCQNTSFGHDMGTWQILNGWPLIFTWLSYWVILAYMNTWVYQKLKH